MLKNLCIAFAVSVLVPSVLADSPEKDILGETIIVGDIGSDVIESLLGPTLSDPVPTEGACQYECSVQLSLGDPTKSRFRRVDVVWVQTAGDELRSCKCPTTDEVGQGQKCPVSENGAKASISLDCTDEETVATIE